MSDHQITMVVRDKIPVLSGERYIVCHNEDYALILDLDAEWDAYDTVTVLFHMPRGGTVTVLSEGRRCAVPACTEQGIMRVGITAGNVLRTSTPAEITVLRSARNDAEEEAVTMPPDITQQIIERQDELEKKIEHGGADPDVIIGFNRADVLLNTIKPSTFYVEKGSLLDVKEKVLAGGIPNTVIRHHFSGDGIVEYHFDPSGQYFNFGSGDDSIIFEFIARFGSVQREYTVKATGDDIHLNKFTTAISTAVVSKESIKNALGYTPADDADVTKLSDTIADFPYVIATSRGISADAEDNTPALQALVDELSSDGGGTIFFPAGRYNFKISSAGGQQGILYPNNVSIVGENVSSTVLAQVGDTRFSLFYKMATSTSPVSGCNFSNFTVDGSALPNNGTPTGKAFYFQYVQDCVFRDLCLRDTIATAMGIDYLDRVIIDNVNCVNCGRAYDGEPVGCSGIGIGTGGLENENFTITNCVCVGSGQYGIFIENQHNLGWGGNVEYSKGVVIANCIVRNGKNNGIGVRGGENVTIIGCETYKNAANGIYIDNKCRNVKIINCSATENTANGLCIDADTDSVGIVVKGCTFINNTQKGVRVNTATGKMCITDVFSYGNTEGLYIGGITLADCVLMNNALLDGNSVLANFTGITEYNDFMKLESPSAITADAIQVTEGLTAQIVYNVTPSNANKSVTYESSNTNIATVTADGYVYGVADGECDITITSTVDNSVTVVIKCNVVASVIPAEYTQLSYLQSDGTAYIDINYAMNTNSVFECTAAFIDGNYKMSNYGAVEQIGSEYARAYFGSGDTGILVNCKDGEGGVVNIPYDTDYHTFVIAGSYVKIDDNQDVRTASNPTLSMWLFKRNANITIRDVAVTSKIQSVKVWEDDALVRDYVPVKRTADDVYGLYETVNGVFYTNANDTGVLTGA